MVARAARFSLISVACALLTACTSPLFSAGEARDAAGEPACAGKSCAPNPVEAGVQPGTNPGNASGVDASPPRLDSDAGPLLLGPGSTNDAGGSNAGGPSDGGQAAADPMLLGKYAIRMRYHGADSSGLSKFAQESIALGEIALDASSGKHVLSLTHWCQDHAVSSTAAGSIEAKLWRPEAYPNRTYQLQVTGDAFSTTGPAAMVGYDSHLPSACSPGAQVSRQEGQVWLTGNCSCPKGDPSAAPTQQDDCRVTDSDGDGHPGFTVIWTGQLNGDNYFARRDLSQLSFGKIDRSNRKHTAQYVQNHEHKQLNCSSTCTPPPAYRPCADTSVNTVLFEPIDDASYNCAAVSDDVSEGKLFTPDPLANVQAC